jgi:hypothetical protein
MAISQKSIKILWSAAGGRCAFLHCWERLCFHEAAETAPYTLGEMAHICGDQPGANRHNPKQTDAERNDYQNLILLCPNHHTLIDRIENAEKFNVAVLHEMKTNHEAKVSDRLDKGQLWNKKAVALAILPLLEENKQSWAQYGPTSELARMQPYNEAVYAVWVTERLSVIVPNNRKIIILLSSHEDAFGPEEQEAIASFRLHVRSYEQWVNDLISYQAVRRFPIVFDDLIRKTLNVGIQ